MTTRFSNRPLYLQVRDALAERIASREWAPGGAIPNEGDLARQFGVSAGTMRKALELLESERLLTRRQGRGTFVNDQASEELAIRYSNVRQPDGQHVSENVEVLDAALSPVSEVEGRRLRLRLHDKVHRIRRLRFSDGKPYLLEDVALPAALFPGLSEYRTASHRIVVLAQQFGVLLGRGEERVTLGSASPDVARALQVKPAAPLLTLDRIVYTLDGRPAEWRFGHCHLADKCYLAETK
ncbi:MAG: GntR family transcriptional regulator [Hyphomonadaceae bacterium]|jgi:GntR family transcriptional regulator|nr:GntR family transcriptional regulator [Hyphomonadaceae bacterium]